MKVINIASKIKIILFSSFQAFQGEPPSLQFQGAISTGLFTEFGSFEIFNAFHDYYVGNEQHIIYYEVGEFSTSQIKIGEL